MSITSRFGRAIMVVAILLITIIPHPAGAAADESGTATYNGVLSGGTFGLHVTKYAPSRVGHPVVLDEGATGAFITLQSTDFTSMGRANLYVKNPVGDIIARGPGGASTSVHLDWRHISASGFGEYTAFADCDLCGFATYEMTIEVLRDAHAINMTVEDARMLVAPAAATSTIVNILNAGSNDATVSLANTPVPTGWAVAISPASLALAAGESGSATVTVTPPADVAPGTRAVFDVLATSPNRSVAVGIEAAYSDAIASLKARGQSVIALIDTGINPYHEEFRGTGSFDEHPAWFVDGYPHGAEALPLTFDAATYAEAKAADADVWAGVKGNTLYYVPGTRIAGMICVGGCRNLDEGGHGTGTASLAAGATLGEAPESLIVSVTGDIFGGARWAARQGWIDVISMSLGLWAGGPTVGINDPVSGGTGNPYVPFSMPGAQKTAYDSGKRWFSGSAGGAAAWANTGPATGGAVPVEYGTNVPSPNGGQSSFSGTPWTFAVEPYWPDNEQTWRNQGYPPDMVANGWDLIAASGASLTGTNSFGHASGATPQPAGMYARIVMEARKALGSSQEGPVDGVLATAGVGASLPAAGPLADGVFTIDEAEAVLLHSLEQVNTVESVQEHGFSQEAFDRSMVTAPGAEYVTQGWGLLTDDARALALDVLAGTTPMPFRPQDDAAYAAVFTARLAFWEPQVMGEVWVF